MAQAKDWVTLKLDFNFLFFLLQVAHFNTPFGYDSLENIHQALNGLLPSDIRIREICSVLPEFHARFSVKSKIYTYKIYNDTIMDPFQRHFAYHSLYKLNAAAMRNASRHFVGTHNFSAFANASRNDRTPNPVKNIFRFDVHETVLSPVQQCLPQLLGCLRNHFPFCRDPCCSLKSKVLVFYTDKFVTWFVGSFHRAQSSFPRHCFII